MRPIQKNYLGSLLVTAVVVAVPPMQYFNLARSCLVSNTGFCFLSFAHAILVLLVL